MMSGTWRGVIALVATALAVGLPASATAADAPAGCAATSGVVGDWCHTHADPRVGCPEDGRAAVADKAAQRFWLCEGGTPVSAVLPMTTGGIGYGLPPVGTYTVSAKHEHWSGMNGEPLQRFVAFYRTVRGNQIAFHDVVNQDPATVGALDQRGASAGGFRLRPADSMAVWDHLQLGDTVVVLTP